MNEYMTEIYNRFIEFHEKNKRYAGLKNSFETFEKTGSHCFLHEIYNKENCTLVDKAYFSENLMYIPHRFIIAYKDIAEIVHLTGINEYEIVMIDGTKYHICMLKITRTELSKHVSPQIVQQMDRSKLGFLDFLFMIFSPIAIPLLFLFGVIASIFKKEK